MDNLLDILSVYATINGAFIYYISVLSRTNANDTLSPVASCLLFNTSEKRDDVFQTFNNSPFKTNFQWE